MQNPETIDWAALLRAVRADQPELYRSWFEELRQGELEGGELCVLVDDPARAGYLRDHCARAFVDNAMRQTGRLLPVRFVCTKLDHHAPHATSGELGLTSAPITPDYTFEQFVVGPSNRLAHAACRAVCSQAGTLYNPLFIHGPSGTGKTHLLQAICSALMADSQPGQIIYTSCETFVNEFVRAIEAGRLQQFRDNARRARALVIDDVQFLANRESSQEELFHTFNTLYQSRRQIVLSADSPPSEIPTLEDRLVSRFNWGLVAQVDLPNRETRQAILQKKARLRGCQVPDEVLDFIAERVESNVRLLEGALTKLMSESQLTGRPLTVETARDVLDSFDGHQQRPLQISDILETISTHYGIRIPELLGRKRTRSLSHPRQIGMYLARKLTPLSLEEIGMHFGGRDHSTVLHAERVIENIRAQDKETAETLTVLTRRLLAHR